MRAKRQSQFEFISGAIFKSLLFSLLIMLAFGYLMGYNVILVDGWSAEPYIYKNSVVITQKLNNSDYKIGDFVTFMVGTSRVTHQIVSIDDETGEVICRGWNYNSTIGEYQLQKDTQVITFDNIVGKVIFANYMIGNTIFIIRENMLILFGLLGMLVLLFIIKENYTGEQIYE